MMSTEKQLRQQRKYLRQWKPGESGNPGGRLKGAPSLAAALRRWGIKRSTHRAELARIAGYLGLNEEDICNIDVVAALVYEAVIHLLARLVKGEKHTGETVVGLLQMISRSLDGADLRANVSPPMEIEAVMANVSAVLGIRAQTVPLPSPIREGNSRE